MTGVLDRVCALVATDAYLSYIPIWFVERAGARATRLRAVRWTGAGFVGAAVGWLTLYALPDGGPLLGLTLAVSIAAACVASDRAERRFGRHDDPRIIVDETVGYWTAVAWLPREPALLLAGFVLFRALDAGKVGPLRWLERLPGGVGVVADDVGAGLAANVILRGLCWLMPGLLG